MWGSSLFMPHLHCYLGNPWLVWGMFTTDLLIGLAYLSISLTLWGLVKKTKLQFSFVVLSFGIFIGACGLTHFLEVWTLWHPDYWLSLFVKLVTAIASIGTGIYLYRLRDKIELVASAAEHAQTLARELQVRELADSMTQLAWIARPDGHIFWYNKRWYEYTGTRPEDMEGWGWEKVHNPELLPQMLSVWRKALATGEPWEDTFQLRSREGEYRWFLSRAVPLRDEQGKIIRWFGTNTDIHEHKKTATELEAKSAQLEAIVNSMPLAVTLAEAPSGKLIYSSQNFEAIWRQKFVTDDFAGGYGNYTGLHADGRRYELMDWPLARAIRNGEVVSNEDTEILFGDGSRGILRLSASPIRDIKGNIVAGVVLSEDVTERKKVEESLKDTVERLSLATASAQIGIWELDIKSGMVQCSEILRDIFGFKELTVHVSEVFAKLSEQDKEQTHYALESAIKNKTDYTAEFRIVRTNGSVAWLFGSARAYYDSRGEPTRMIGLNIDITQRKKFEHDLQHAKQEAERANELKSAFLANMSHEIRTPLGAMLGFADLLRNPDVSAEERSNYVDVLTRNGHQLSVIINDILDLSKVEAGHLDLERTEVDPIEIADDVLSLFRVKAREKNLELEFRKPERPLALIVSDPVRVRQVLMNLVGNATKFTQQGKVSVSVGQKMSAGSQKIEFLVEDTGIGVSEDQRERVFEMFVQADGSMTRRFGGTGLGLALSRRLARELGGDVEIVRSEPGVGTTFSFTIEDQTAFRSTPQTAQAKADAKFDQEIPPNGLQNVKVLIVDDSEDNRQLFWRCLESYGATIDVAENGLEGYQKALNNSFDIVLMDIQMPVMDGYTAAAKLRHDGFTPPIIALTAHAMSEVSQRCKAVGCTDSLSKPIRKQELVSSVYRNVKAIRRTLLSQ